MEQTLVGTGLSVRMRAVLEMLATGPATVPDLAHRLEIKRQYVQVMVNEVLAAGYAEKRENPRHKASPLLALSATGQTVINDVLARERAVLATIGSALPEVEIAAARDLVERLMEAIDTHSAGRGS